MFRKILIANRGEIACRIIRTARRMGIATVAVYSEADAEALHVRMADEAIPIGPAPSAESYLNIERIVEACRQSGAEAVHPGYGFLSENPAFARALAKAGVTFIGPRPDGDRRDGRQDRIEEAGARAGVSSVPGHLDVIPDAEAAVAIARDIGYPVMIKASAGGRRQGHADRRERRARSATGFARRRARRNRALPTTGSLSRNTSKSRATSKSRCSATITATSSISASANARSSAATRRSSRRRRARFSTPIPAKPWAGRRSRWRGRSTIARPARSSSSSTSERNFYFLEMNTRLQVEHPVTELVTGLDLVELMIRIAAGEPLPFAQKDVEISRLGDRGAGLCGGPEAQFSPLDRPPRPLSAARRRRRLGSIRGLRRCRDQRPLRSDDRQARRLRARPRHGDRPAVAMRSTGSMSPACSTTSRFWRRSPQSRGFRAGALSTDFIAEEFPGGFARPFRLCRADRVILLAAALAHRRTARARDVDRR